MQKDKKQLTLKICSLIIITEVIDSIAELFFKKGTLATEMTAINLQNLIQFFTKLFFNYPMWLGVLLYLANFFIWILVLSRVDLSVAFPIGSVTYIIVLFLSLVFLHEHVSALRWLGTAIIIIGVYFIFKSTRINQIKNES